MVRLAVKVIENVIKIMCPGPSKDQLKHDISEILRGSINNNNMGNSNETCIPPEVMLGPPAISIKDAVTSSTLDDLLTILKKSKKGSIQKRVVRALIIKCVRKNLLKGKCKEHGVNDLTGGKIRQDSVKDFDAMISGETLEKKSFTINRTEDEKVKEVVSYILHRDHIVTTAWGDRQFNLGLDEEVTLPRLTRKVSPLHLWDSYKKTHQNDRIGRSSFYNIVRDLTVSGRDIVTSVDYVQALLVNEPVELLQEVVDSLCHSTDSDKLSDYLSAVSMFLKNRYQVHVSMTNDDCASHDVKYILSRQSKVNGANLDNQKEHITCAQCRFPFYTCYKIKESIESNGSFVPGAEFREQIIDAFKVIDECQNKFQLYMSHKARCTNQNVAIDKIHQKMKDTCISSNGKKIITLMIGDYKMKFEPISSRETQIDHYGKRGISWHGFCLQFYLLEKERTKDGTTVSVPKKYTVYIDQIISDGNKQDSMSVYSLLDAALAQISDELPFISEIILQTDNAKTYNNAFLLCAIAVLNFHYFKNGLSIIEFMHTETQDGKTILDAHFARCMQFIRQFLSCWKRNKILKINTPTALGFALSFNGGLKNVAVQVVNMDNVRTMLIEKEFEGVCMELKTYFARINHAYFYPERTTQDSQDNNILNTIKTMKFAIGVQSYSNIDRVVSFNIDMTKESVENKVRPDEKLLRDIELEVNGVSIDSHSSDQNQKNIHEQELKDVVASLLDLHHAEDQYSSDENNTKNDHHLDDIIAKANTSQDIVHDFIVNEPNDNDCSDDSSVDSLYLSEDSDNDLDEAFYDVDQIVNKRIYAKPEGEMYQSQNFSSKVEIEMMLPFGNIVSFEEKSTKKRKTTLTSSFKCMDMRSKAIRIANDHIQTGDLQVTSATMDNPVLLEAAVFPKESIKFKLDQGWGRRNNIENSTLYGNTYIEQYKSDIEEFFDEGTVNNSRKMNAAMMREQLKKLYPNRYSIPGETEIKKHINYLSNLSKKGTKSSSNLDVELELNDQELAISRDWKLVITSIVKENHNKKPAKIYEEFLKEMVQVRQVKENELPTMKQVKSKIGSLKGTIKKQLKRSII